MRKKILYVFIKLINCIHYFLLMTQVAGISTQGITSFWAQKKIRKSSEDVSHSPNFIGLLIAFTSFIVVLIFLLMYARKCIRCSLIKEHSNTMPLKATNSSAINGISNDMIEVEETSINSKFTHLMVPNSSERKISIRNSPFQCSHQVGGESCGRAAESVERVSRERDAMLGPHALQVRETITQIRFLNPQDCPVQH